MNSVIQRRAFAGALIALLFAAILAPLLQANPEASLPACCRTHGEHHCMMSEASSASAGFAALAEKCPYFPKGVAAEHFSTSLPANLLAAAGAIVSHPAGVKQTEARYRESCNRHRHKRGPPSLLFANYTQICWEDLDASNNVFRSIHPGRGFRPGNN